MVRIFVSYPYVPHKHVENWICWHRECRNMTCIVAEINENLLFDLYGQIKEIIYWTYIDQLVFCFGVKLEKFFVITHKLRLIYAEGYMIEHDYQPNCIVDKKFKRMYAKIYIQRNFIRRCRFCLRIEQILHEQKI